MYRTASILTFGGGTNEVQRDITMAVYSCQGAAGGLFRIKSPTRDKRISEQNILRKMLSESLEF